MTQERRDQLQSFLAALGLTPPSADCSLAVLDEALTHTSAGLAFNHERLEFLGDAVLRLAASEFLERHYPQLSVGQSSALRAQLVSDRWLAELGERCQIEALLRIGPTAAGDQAGRATLRAEACEAVIGALYQLWGNLEPVHRWLTPHWQRDAAQWEADPNRHNWKSALQEWSQANRQGLPQYSSREVSQIHADPQRFHCEVRLGDALLGEGRGGSRRLAEQDAARAALEQLKPARGS
ncbi:MAG: ribonuclease III [Synechococcaceae bacterium WB8_1B_136]|nr:ribonuclease III [Synechococcaceae bacterium WB8_1B_136]